MAKYCMAIVDDTKEYLKIIANSYTGRRELISQHKLHNWIFGDVKIDLTGCNKLFLDILKTAAKD